MKTYYLNNELENITFIKKEEIQKYLDNPDFQFLDFFKSRSLKNTSLNKAEIGFIITHHEDGIERFNKIILKDDDEEYKIEIIDPPRPTIIHIYKIASQTEKLKFIKTEEMHEYLDGLHDDENHKFGAVYEPNYYGYDDFVNHNEIGKIKYRDGNGRIIFERIIIKDDDYDYEIERL